MLEEDHPALRFFIISIPYTSGYRGQATVVDDGSNAIVAYSLEAAQRITLKEINEGNFVKCIDSEGRDALKRLFPDV